MIQLPKDEARLVLEGFVDFNNFSAYGGKEVAGSLYGLNGAEILAFGHFVAYFRHVNVYDVAEGVLCIVSDADSGDVAFEFHPFVGIRVAAIV